MSTPIFELFPKPVFEPVKSKFGQENSDVPVKTATQEARRLGENLDVYQCSSDRKPKSARMRCINSPFSTAAPPDRSLDRYLAAAKRQPTGIEAAESPHSPFAPTVPPGSIRRAQRSTKAGADTPGSRMTSADAHSKHAVAAGGAPAGQAATPVIRAALYLLAAIAAANVYRYVIGDHPRPFAADFYYAYGAAQAWAAGLSPYSEEYYDFVRFPQFLALRDPPAPFPYPPNTVALYALVGWLSPGAASLSLSILNAAALAWASWMFASIAARLDAGVRAADAVAIHFIAFGLVWSAGEVAFSGVMLMPVIYAAVLTAVVAGAAGRPAVLAIALAVALFKPQTGLPLACFYLAGPATRRASLWALTATAALGLAGLLAGGVASSLRDFLVDLGSYGSYAENAPNHLAGAGFIVNAAFGAAPPNFAWLGPTCAAAFVIGRKSRMRRGAGNPADSAAGIAAGGRAKDSAAMLLGAFATLALTLFLLPSHNNYAILTIPFALFVRGVTPTAIAIAVGLVLHARAWTIGSAIDLAGIGHVMMNTAAIDTFAAAILLAAFVALLGRWRPERQ